MAKAKDITSHLYHRPNGDIIGILVVTEDIFNILCDEIIGLNLGDLNNNYRPVDESLLRRIRQTKCLPWIENTEKTAELFKKYNLVADRFSAIVRGSI